MGKTIGGRETPIMRRRQETNIARPRDRRGLTSSRPAQQSPMSLHAPDIYVVPPAEDSVAPWCCHNSHTTATDDDDDDDSVRFIQASHRTPYFHRTMTGSGSLILPSRKPSSDTQSIVDALGDADDFSDEEIDPGPMHAVPEEDEGDADLADEMGVAHQVSPPPPPEPYSEVGDDSDIIEVFKLRRQSMRATHTYDDYHGTLGPSTDFNKSSIRFRATKAFRSLRGAVRPSPTLPDVTDTGNTIAPSASTLKSASKLRPKLKLKPRAQVIFNPIENVSQPEKTDTHQLPSRPSSRLAQIFPPRLRQRPSNISFAGSSPDLSAQSPSNQTSETLPIAPAVFHREPIPSFAPSRRSSSSTRTQQASEPLSTNKSYSNQHSHVGSRNSSAPTTHQTLPRSFYVSRPISPVPLVSQSSGRFSIRRLHRIFRKTSFSNIHSDDSSRVDQAPSIGSSHSTCPSLSSTRTSECSVRTTPTLDTVPQTPTSFDENETRRTIVPLPSSSTVGSGISLGSSLNSGAVSSLSSSNTASSVSTTATRGSVFSTPVFHPRNATCSQSSSQASVASLTHSVSVSDSTSGAAPRAGASNDPIPSPLLASPFSEIKLADLDLQLGLGIDLFSNGANNSSARSGSSRTAMSTSRSLSLRNLSSRLRKGRAPIPPMPSSSSTESGMSMEMKLNSLHFDDISFDVDRFMAL